MMTRNKLLIKYKIQPFDTIEQIAQKLNTNVYSIFDINREVDFNNLYVGQDIYVNPNGNDHYSHQEKQMNKISDIDLMKVLRMLWEQHVYWTRFVILSMVENLSDVQQVTDRLLRNPWDFTALLENFYGKSITDTFRKLFTNHLTIAAELVQTTKDGNSHKATEAERRWYINADEIAAFFASINPFWSKEQWRKMLNEHLALTKTEAAYLITKKYSESIQIFDEIENQALMMADIMLQGLLNQFYK